MRTYHIDKTAITPAEAIEIARHMSSYTGFYVLPEFAQAVADLTPYAAWMGSESVRNMQILMAIWSAGRVQGIREERERRKSKLTGGGNDAA